MPPAAAVKARLSVMFPVAIDDAFAATATVASAIDDAGAVFGSAGATGDGAGVPVMIWMTVVLLDVPRSVTVMQTRSIRGFVGSAAATVRTVAAVRPTW
jgi:hypothetical protein